MPSLLVIDEDPAVVHAFRRNLQDMEVTVFSTQSGARALQLLAEYHPDAVILNSSLPDQSGLELLQRIHDREAALPVILMAASGTASAIIEAIARGAFDCVSIPVDFEKIRGLVLHAFRTRQLLSLSAGLPTSGSCDPVMDGLIGECPAMQEVYKAIGRVASKKVNVLIVGESGTGKELVAQAIQRHSPRAAAPFVAVNCAAIPETLLESELFGHEKGSFTGADSQHIGKFEQCSGGTLFLDEVGDMSLVMQSKVLRLLQEGRFDRVGSNKTVEVDVRIIAATNRDLEQLVVSGQFRLDLFYRLNVFSIHLPSLRERTSDIPLLVDYFLDLFCRELDRPPCKASPEALALLASHPWRGNVRELQSVLKRALLHVNGPLLTAEDLPLAPASNGNCTPTSTLDNYIEERLKAGSTALHAEALAFMERVVLTRVLRHTGGNQSEAAQILNITRGTLRSRIRQLGIAIQRAVEVDTVEPAGTRPWPAMDATVLPAATVP